MDIFNRPPTIADDTVIYRIYPPQDVSSDKTAVSSISALMLSYVQDSLLPSNHIWHRDAFTLKVVEEEERSGKSANQWVIEGTMRVGDCVDDEWCVVWLLTEISKKWDVVISVYDSDGEFLLIEAAEHLPNWVTPTNSENRIWIHRSQLHIIPLEHISPKGRPQGSRRRALPNQEEEDEIQESEESYISIQDALRIVRDSTIPTVASPAVQEAAFARIKEYPGVLSQHVHTTKVYLPSDVVLALSQNPSLVQKAVEAFYTRDALQLRAAARMTRFPPSTSILAPVTLTRTAYAQLSGQKFHPPRIFGVWQEQEGTKEWRYKDIGMKIACGFEMVYSESKSNAGVTGVSTTSQESVSWSTLTDDDFLTCSMDIR
ncbi:hypothetical protein FRC02_000505 [Tulasnella sp. 418]|nr:hypothetical protein FRC02_000505 [Tulasnella sp. 418]